MTPDSELLFDGGRLVPSRNHLEVGGREVRLEPQVAEVLAFLISASGQVLSKEEIIRHVWQGRAVSDDVLVVAIYELRKALRDDARRPTFIETIPRRGYRWLLPVTLPQDGPAGDSLPDASEARRSFVLSDPRAAPKRRPDFGRTVTIAALVGLLLLILFTYLSQIPQQKDKPVSGFTRTSVPDLEPHVRSLYLQAEHLLGRRSSSDLKRAAELLEQVVDLAPGLPAGHAALAQTYAHMADRNLGDRLGLYFQGRTAAERALELDPQQARAHVALAMVALIFDWDGKAAEAWLARARELEPNLADIYQVLAWLRSAQGRGDEAEAAARMALELQPVTPSHYGDLAFLLSISGKAEEALEVLDQALELDPAYAGGHAARYSANLLLNRPDAAVAAHQEALRLSGAPEDLCRKLAERYREAGLDAYLRLYLDHLPQGRALVLEATLLATLGEPNAALDRLERAADRHETEILWAPYFPQLASLRTSPRFQALVERVSLADS